MYLSGRPSLFTFILISSSERSSSTALPKPPDKECSSIVIIPFTLPAIPTINSLSRGFTNLAFITATETPSSLSLDAASRAGYTVFPIAIIATSSPSNIISPFPISILFKSLSRETPMPSPLG